MAFLNEVEIVGSKLRIILRINVLFYKFVVNSAAYLSLHAYIFIS